MRSTSNAVASVSTQFHPPPLTTWDGPPDPGWAAGRPRTCIHPRLRSGKCPVPRHRDLSDGSCAAAVWLSLAYPFIITVSYMCSEEGTKSLPINSRKEEREHCCADRYVHRWSVDVAPLEALVRLLNLGAAVLSAHRHLVRLVVNLQGEWGNDPEMSSRTGTMLRVKFMKVASPV